MRRIIAVPSANITNARSKTTASFLAQYNSTGDDSSATYYGAEVDCNLGTSILAALVLHSVPHTTIELSDEDKVQEKITFLSDLGIQTRTP